MHVFQFMLQAAPTTKSRLDPLDLFFSCPERVQECMYRVAELWLFLLLQPACRYVLGGGRMASLCLRANGQAVVRQENKCHYCMWYGYICNWYPVQCLAGAWHARLEHLGGAFFTL